MHLRLLLSACLCLLAACANHRDIEPIPYKPAAGVAHAQEWLGQRAEGEPLLLQSWLPPTAPPKALLLYVPANVEHGGLIAPVAESLVREGGFGVFAVDLRGLGRSAKNGDYYFVRDHDAYLRDIADAASHVRQQFPGVSLHGAGESLGAALLLRADIQGAVRFDSLVLADTAFQPNPGLGVLPLPDFMARFMVWSGGQVGKALPFMPSVPARFSINAVSCSKKTRGNLLRDPYVVKDWLPASFITTLADTQRVIDRGLETVHTPLLVIHGSKDGVVPVRSSREIIRRAASTDKRMFVIPDGCHATMIEEGTQPHVARMVGEWLGRGQTEKAPARANAL